MSVASNTASENQPQIVAATERDLPAISSLAGIIWRTCYPGIITLQQINYMLGWMYSIDAMHEEISSRGIRYDLLFVNDQLIGFSSYGPGPSADVFKLHKLYLLREWQRRGLGSLLLGHCEREIRKAGARRLILNVNKANTGAIAAYRKNGFAVTESIVADIGGGFVMDDYIMTKELR